MNQDPPEAHNETTCSKCQSNELRLYCNDYDTFVASCEYQIPRLWFEYYNEEYPFETHLTGETLADVWSALPDAFLCRLDVTEPGSGTPQFEEKTCGEWARSNGEGHLVSLPF